MLRCKARKIWLSTIDTNANIFSLLISRNRLNSWRNNNNAIIFSNTIVILSLNTDDEIRRKAGPVFLELMQSSPKEGFHLLGSLSANKRFHRTCLVELRKKKRKKKETLNHVAITVRLPDSYHVLTSHSSSSFRFVFDMSWFYIHYWAGLWAKSSSSQTVRERFNSRASINTVTFVY